VTSRLIVFQTTENSLLVGEEYSLQNSTQPPVTYYNQQGDFDFELPPGAELSQVSSWGPAGMPIVQSTINRGNSKYSIAYAFQPGENGVRLSYQMPYSSNQARLQLTSPYAAQRIMLVAPPSMQVNSTGFTATGSEQGFNIYTREAVAGGTVFEVAVSGTAPPPPNLQTQDPVGGRGTNAAIQTMPDRLDSLKWILIIGFAALFALGTLLVWRKPILIATDGAAAMPGGNHAGRKRRSAKTTTAGATSTAEVDREVEQSLDGLKDKLFRLELRRQAGTITPEQYEQERARTEKILRELVQG
jgi:hypothetical protein